MFPVWGEADVRREDASSGRNGRFEYNGVDNGIDSVTLTNKLDESFMDEGSNDDFRCMEALLQYLSQAQDCQEEELQHPGGCMADFTKRLNDELSSEKSRAAINADEESRSVLWITDRLIEIELRVGCSPTLIFRRGRGREKRELPEKLTSQKMCQWEMNQLRRDAKYLSRPFESNGTDRVTIRNSLHRISGSKQNMIIRIGRVPNRLRTYSPIQLNTYKSRLYTIVSKLLKGEGVLITGKPGVGKTTFLRDVARAVGTCGNYIQQNSNRDENGRCVIVDKHDEICGGVEASIATFPAFRSGDSGQGANEPGLTNAVQTSTPRCIIADEIGSMEETDALGAIAGLGVAVLATLHFHVDTNKPNIGRIQQALVKSILSHRTLNGLAGGLVYTTLGDRVAQERGVKKNFASSKFATLPFKWCLYMRDTNPMSWPDMFDMHYEAKIAIDELNTAAGTPAREMQFNASPNVGSGGNRRRKRSRDDFAGDLENANYDSSRRNRSFQRHRLSRNRRNNAGKFQDVSQSKPGAREGFLREPTLIFRLRREVDIRGVKNELQQMCRERQYALRGRGINRRSRRNTVFLDFMRPDHAEDCLTFIHKTRALDNLFEKIERKRNY